MLDPDHGRKGAEGSAGRRFVGRTLLSHLAVLAMGLALGAAAARARSPTTPAPDNVRFVVQPFDVLSKGSVALSRDGRRLVYWDSAHPGIFVRELDQTEGRVLPGTATLAGGDPIAICDTLFPASPGAAWGQDGTILFSPTWQTGLAEPHIHRHDPDEVRPLPPRAGAASDRARAGHL